MCKSKYSAIKILFVLSILVATMFCFNIVLISGDSMNPTYKHGDILLAIKSKAISKDDVVVFKLNDEVFVKRVYAVPGDTLEIIDCEIYVNGMKLSQYLCEQDDCKFVLQNNEYYLLGDNYNDSIDSRSFGSIEDGQIISKVIGKIFSIS